jgi:hypothetical protein
MTTPASEPAPARAPTAAEAVRVQDRVFRSVILVVFTAGFFAYAGLVAETRALWLDEITTHWLAQVPSVSAVWSAIAVGTEQNPPLYFLTARATSTLLGPGPLALRAPSIVGFWLMCLALYTFVARRWLPAFAWAAMILPTCTMAMRYAFEARAYAMWLGLSAGALVCWQGAAIGRRRWPHLAGLAACLGLGVWSQFYSVLLFVPLGLAELVRTRARRRFDAGIWAAFALGLAPILGLLGLIRRNAQLRDNFWAEPRWSEIVDTYKWLLKPAVTPLVAALAVVVWLTIRKREAGTREAEPGGFEPAPAHELVAVSGFLALPVITMVLAKLVTNAYTPRYAVPTVIGLDLLIVLAAVTLTRNRAAAGVALALTFGGWIVAAWNPDAERDALPRLTDMSGVAQAADLAKRQGLPWVLSDSNTYIELLVGCPPEQTGPLLFVSGVEEWSGEKLIRCYQQWSPPRELIRSIDFKELRRRRQPFLYLYDPTARKAFVTQALRRGARFVWRDTVNGYPLFEVSWPVAGPARPRCEQPEAAGLPSVGWQTE